MNNNVKVLGFLITLASLCVVVWSATITMGSETSNAIILGVAFGGLIGYWMR